MTITQEVSTREFLRDYQKWKKNPVIVTYRGKKEGVYVPYDEYEKKEEVQKGKFVLKDLEKYFFKGPKDLSSRIDDIYLQ